MNRRSVMASVGLWLIVTAGCGGDDDDAGPRPTPTSVATLSATGTATAVPSATRPPSSPTANPSPSLDADPSPSPTAPLPSATPSITATPTVTATASQTSTPRPPRVTYLGVTRADDLVQTTELFDAEGRPIYERVLGQGLTLVLEAERGTAPLVEDAYDPFGALPGAQFIVSRALGDGSLAVCDYAPPMIGGVPATIPFGFDDAAGNADAINDLGCRVNDGTGVPRMRSDSAAACTRDLSAEFRFVDPASDGQYCLPIARAWAFPPGDTIVAARVQDQFGLLSEPREMVIRVGGEVPFDCADGLGERIFTVARADSGVFFSVAPGQDASLAWTIDPIRLCGGPDIGDGVHTVTLRADAVLGMSLGDGTALCVRLFARGSDGTIDCDGGTPHDVRASQDEEGVELIEVEGGLGEPAGAGAMSIGVRVGISQMPVGFPPSECGDVAAFDSEFSAILTTTEGRAEITPSQAGPPSASLAAIGTNFTCATWRTGDDARLVLPFPAVNTELGDLAAAIVLGD